MKVEVKDFTFDDMAQMCPGYDIERFRDDFDVMFDMNGVVFSQTIGFHFSFDDEEPARQEQFVEMVKLFQPVALWAGSAELHKQLTDLGYTAKRFPYFQDGGFMVVLKIPYARLPKAQG